MTKDNVFHKHRLLLHQVDEQTKTILDLDNAFLKLLFEEGTDGIYLLDLNGNLLVVSPAFANLIGYAVDEIIGEDFKPFVAREDYKKSLENFKLAKYGKSSEYPLTLVDKSGKKVEVIAQKHPLFKDGEVIGVYGILKNISEDVRIQKIVDYYEKYDRMTQLPNHANFAQLVATRIATKQYSQLVVLIIDISKFELVNESLGYTVGDKLLKEVAYKLKHLDNGYEVARLNNDQFMLLMDGVKTESEVEDLTQAIQRFIKGPYNLSGHEYLLTSNIGISVYPKDGNSPDILLRHAMLALQQAKRAEGIDSYRFFNKEMSGNRFEHFLIESKLKTALINNEFTIYYQPRVSVKTNEIIGMEALLRWEHPIIGKISPNEFIPIAEETGLIIPIGNWILRTACQQNKAWQDEGLGQFRVSVNVSAKQLLQTNFIDNVLTILKETQLDPKWLELEITESMIMHNEENTISLLKKLKEIGIKIAIDDFGTGYSSLSYLKQFPVDILKIDKSFIDDITDEKEKHLISSAIITLGLNLGMGVVAEGVENEEQMNFLRDNNCTEFQGYLYSKPLPAHQFTALLQSKNQQ